MGCNCHNKNKNQPIMAIKQEEPLMELKRPSTPSLTELQKKPVILFFIGDVRSCSEGNRYVDYIIRWLIEDGIRYEKYNINHPYASKFKIMKTPSIVINETTIQWRGIALTYREIISFLSSIYV
jgi:hypothetical protein